MYAVLLFVLMQGILDLSVEVTESNLLMHFLTQTQCDKDDEVFNNRINAKCV